MIRLRLISCFSRYGRPLYAFIVRMVSDQATAEDVFQDTWMRIVRNVDSFRGDCKFSSWMFQIALNLCRNVARSRSKREFVELEKAGQLAQETGCRCRENPSVPENKAVGGQSALRK